MLAGCACAGAPSQPKASSAGEAAGAAPSVSYGRHRRRLCVDQWALRVHPDTAVGHRRCSDRRADRKKNYGRASRVRHSEGRQPASSGFQLAPGDPWLLFGCNPAPSQPQSIALYSFATGQWQGVANPAGQPIAIGAHWIEYDESCGAEHCADAVAFQNIDSGQYPSVPALGDWRPGGTTIPDLNSPQLAIKLCSPLRVPRGSSAPHPGELSFAGPFAIAFDQKTPYDLQPWSGVGGVCTSRSTTAAFRSRSTHTWCCGSRVAWWAVWLERSCLVANVLRSRCRLLRCLRRGWCLALARCICLSTTATC